MPPPVRSTKPTMPRRNHSTAPQCDCPVLACIPNPSGRNAQSTMTVEAAAVAPRRRLLSLLLSLLSKTRPVIASRDGRRLLRSRRLRHPVDSSSDRSVLSTLSQLWEEIDRMNIPQHPAQPHLSQQPVALPARIASMQHLLLPTYCSGVYVPTNVPLTSARLF